MRTISYKDPYNPLPVIVQLDEDDAEEIDEVLSFLDESTKSIQNEERKEQYHTKYHLDALMYEGNEYTSDENLEEDSIRTEEEQRIENWLRNNLTGTQFKRFMLFMEGLSIREIAREESTVLASGKIIEWLKSPDANIKESLSCETFSVSHMGIK